MTLKIEKLELKIKTKKRNVQWNLKSRDIPLLIQSKKMNKSSHEGADDKNEDKKGNGRPPVSFLVLLAACQKVI
ncbi:hypothetical protein [Bacillus sp. CECT 9360]|uniref:hypothetical protein n=1 Tax=Bacillus sp. CECT 9360 TaxID=2845821 RepID=UPI001E4EB30C|nr:hypothetical protein [Bacillus sp. CECT 9360]